MTEKVNANVWLLLAATAFLVLVFIFMQNIFAMKQEIETGLATIRSLEALPTDAVLVAEVNALLEEIKEREARAMSYLGIFESIGLAITVLGIVGTALGAALGISVRGAQETFSKAQSELEAIDKKAQDANLAQFYVSLASTQRDLGDLNGAQQTYEYAKELTPNNPVPYYHIGYILTKLERLDEAEDILKKALELDTSFNQAQAALGFVYRRKGDMAEDDDTKKSYYRLAETSLLKALSNLPRLVDDEGESWYGSLAGLYRRQGRIKEAVVYYEKAAEITPFSSYPLGNLARLALQESSAETNQIYRKVKRLAKREISLDLGNYWAYSDLVASEIVLGENKDALETLQNLFDAIPSDVVDVLPRVIDTITDIQKAKPFEGDRRNTATIEAILKQLHEKAKDEQNESEILPPS